MSPREQRQPTEDEKSDNEYKKEKDEVRDGVGDQT